MSERISANLDSDTDFDSILYHSGDSAAALTRWRKLLLSAWPHGWSRVQVYAARVMELIAAPRVLFVAAQMLRARGPKAPGPNGLRLESLSDSELWELSRALATALSSDTYRPGDEIVRWVRKTHGSSKRPIVLMDVQDRVVQKAAAIILRPMLDPLFDPLSFAYRPMREREQAIAVARQITRADRPVWICHDLRNAFTQIPLSRLLDVVQRLLPCTRLRAFLERVLPPKSRSLGGVKQGGPLSALALEIYLNHFLDQPWRKSGKDVRMIRYADDLLFLARTRDDAAHADSFLRQLLEPTGMNVKDAADDAITDLRCGDADWLGFRFRLSTDGFQIRLAAAATQRLARRFVLALSKDQSARRANQILQHWVGQLGPAYRWVDPSTVCDEASTIARQHGFEEIPDRHLLLKIWADSYKRWKRSLKSVRRIPGFLHAGPLVPPTPTSNIW